METQTIKIGKIVQSKLLQDNQGMKVSKDWYGYEYLDGFFTILIDKNHEAGKIITEMLKEDKGIYSEEDFKEVARVMIIKKLGIKKALLFFKNSNIKQRNLVRQKNNSALKYEQELM